MWSDFLRYSEAREDWRNERLLLGGREDALLSHVLAQLESGEDLGVKKKVPIDRLLESAMKCHQLLSKQGIPHVIMGGTAVYLHGYERKGRGYRDVDLLVREEDCVRLDQLFLSNGYTRDRGKEYRDPEGQSVGLCIKEAYPNHPFPDPGDRDLCETINGLPVPALRELMKIKLAAVKYFTEHPSGNRKKKERNKKHSEDVRGLIVARSLTEDYAEEVRPFRDYYLELLAQVAECHAGLSEAESGA